jgi:hypothetical protein
LGNCNLRAGLTLSSWTQFHPTLQFLHDKLLNV